MRLIIVIFSFFVAMNSTAQVYWQRLVTNYSKQQYLCGNQNWQISQHANGWMYFANNKGLLEYDGVYWNTYSLNHDAKARAVKAMGDRVYVGGLGQFGFFEPDVSGQLKYTDLLPKQNSTAAINIWHIHSLDGKIYFQSDDGMYVYSKDKLHYIPCAKGISYSVVLYERLYAVSRDGIFLLSNNRFQLIPGSETVTHDQVISLLPMDGNILAVTAHKGLFISSGGTFKPYRSKLDEFISDKQISCAAISPGFLALGTMQDGVVLLNFQTGYCNRVSTHNGLQNKTVLSLKFDRENNLWLGLDNGIDCIPLNSYLFFLYSRLSSIGSGYTSVCYDGSLYLGTNQGVYQTTTPTNVNKMFSASYIPGTDGLALSMMVYDDKLFCGGRNYFMIRDHGKTSFFPIRGVWNIVPSTHHPDIIYLGTYWGLSVMKKQANGWTIQGNIDKAAVSAKSMLVEKVTDAIWVANKEKGIYRTILSKDLKQAVSMRCYNSQELPKGNNVCLAEVDNQIIVASRQGLFRYNYATDRLERDLTLENRLGGMQSYSYLYQDSKRNIWYVTQGMMHVLHYDMRRKKYYRNLGEVYLAGELMDDFEHVYELDNDRYVFGTENGYAMLHLMKQYRQQVQPNVQVRYIWIRGKRDSLAYVHSISGTNSPLKLNYQDNSIKIEYSSTNYDKSQTVLYAYRLEGPKNEPWSQYTTSHSKEYTDLPNGHYVFYVRVITTRSAMPIVTKIEFDVLPPWYFTWWAYLFYIILACVLIRYLVMFYRKKQQKLIIENQQRLLQQKKQFEVESSMKDQRIDDLEKEKMRIELRSKSNELMQSRMNVVRKNEMLQEIKKTAMSISSGITEENLKSIRRKVIRLIGQIDNNIEHDDDLEAFQTSFDVVHQDFLSLLKKRYPMLTHKEEMLCIYIRMNLMSKEIAPLLNISLRGVEISRYRLRKKLQLDKGENLNDFLQQLSN